MVGTSGYDRIELDFYPTPEKVTRSFLDAFGDDLEGMVVWEPFCGNGAISKVIEPHCRELISTDIKAYDGFEADMLVDFFTIKTDPEKWTGTPGEVAGITLKEIASGVDKQVPDAIVTNPPYGKDAERFVRRALVLLEPQKGFLAVLCRHEWDTAKGRSDIFDHPAFSTKLTMRYRPRWIEGTEGAPRFSYAWYCWDHSKAVIGAGLRPELRYVA